MKRRTTLIAVIFAASLAIAGLLVYRYLCSQSSIVWIPLQVRPAPQATQPGSAECPEFPAADLPETAQRSASTPGLQDAVEWPMPKLEAFVTDAIARAASGKACASTATVMHTVDTWLQRLIRSDAHSKAIRACLRMRWAMPRVNEIAGTCYRLLRQHHTNDRTRFMLPPLSDTRQIQNADRRLRKLARAYLSNPYNPQRVSDLAVHLGTLELEQPAWRLAEELLQFDSEAAAQLEHELTALKPLSYPGFQF